MVIRLRNWTSWYWNPMFGAKAQCIAVCHLSWLTLIHRIYSLEDKSANHLPLPQYQHYIIISALLKIANFSFYDLNLVSGVDVRRCFILRIKEYSIIWVVLDLNGVEKVLNGVMWWKDGNTNGELPVDCREIVLFFVVFLIGLQNIWILFPVFESQGRILFLFEFGIGVWV